ncbi:MAG TPA: hypothetical protein ACFYEM_11535, partial [Candidatus Hypogeohydataceae bacterium YC40]
EASQTRRKYLKMLFFVSTIGFFLFACIIVLGDLAIPFFFGEKWRNAVPLLQLLLIMTFARMLSPISSQLMFAQGRPDLDFKIRVIVFPLLMGGVTLGAMKGGIIWATAAVAIINALGFVVLVIKATHLIDLKLRDLFNQIFPALACSFLAAFFMFLAEQFLSGLQYNLVLVLLSSISVGIVIYSVSLFIIFRDKFDEFLFLLPGVGPRIAKFLGTEVGVSYSEVQP